MALIKCKECGHQISKKAESCPNCGAVLKKKRGNIGCGGLIVVLIVLFYFYSTIQDSREESAKQQVRSSQLAQYNQNKAQLLEQMKQLIDQGEYLKAKRLAGAYNTVTDPELIKLKNKATELELVEKVAKIPTAETKKNFEIYEKLLKLAPENKAYKDKYSFYNEKMNRVRSIEKQFSQFDGSHTLLEKMIKRSLKNPDSYEHVETVYWDKGNYILVKTTYRGTNSFNAVVTDSVEQAFTIEGDVYNK